MKALAKFFLVMIVSISNFAAFGADTINPFTQEFFARHFKLKTEDVDQIKDTGFEYTVIFKHGKKDSAQEFFDTIKKAAISIRFCDATHFDKRIFVDIAKFQKDVLLKTSELTPKRIEARLTPEELVKIVVNTARIKRLRELFALNADNEAFLSSAQKIKSLDLSGEENVSIADVFLMLERIFPNVNDLNLSRVELSNESLKVLLERLPLTAVSSLIIVQNSYGHLGEETIQQYVAKHQNIKIIYDGWIRETREEYTYTDDCFEPYYGNFRESRPQEDYYAVLHRMEQTFSLIRQARAICEEQGRKPITRFRQVQKVWLPKTTKQEEEPKALIPKMGYISWPDAVRWAFEKYKILHPETTSADEQYEVEKAGSLDASIVQYIVLFFPKIIK